MTNLDFSTKSVLLINHTDINNVCEILNNHRIKYYEAGNQFPHGKVTITESYQSSINFQEPLILKPKKKRVKRKKVVLKKKDNEPEVNRDQEHIHMMKFAKQMDCNSLSDAIKKVGSGGAFRKRFLKEYVH